MASEPRYAVRHRPEPELVDRWGVVTLATGSWLDVHFASEAEAVIAMTILDAGSAPRTARHSSE